MNGVVSVIIPIYNVHKYLVKCIESVIQQTYKNLQIILVDDGSTDGCAAICDRLSQQDSRIEVIHKDNGGLSSARNVGLQAVRGEYVYFLDSDDYIDTGLIAACVNAINSQGCDVVAFNYVRENETGDIIETSQFQKKTFKLSSRKDKIKFLASVQIEYSNFGWHAWNRFYRAEILCNNRLFFPDNREVFAEDLAHAMRVCLYLNKLCVIPDTLYHYVNRDDSIMGALQRNPMEKFVRLCLDFEKFAYNRGFRQEIYSLKGMIFSKILYSEFKKSCSTYRELAEAVAMMEVCDQKRVQGWFMEFKCSQVLYSSHKLHRLYMYCEIVLAKRLLSDGNIYTSPAYWIWLLRRGERFILAKQRYIYNTYLLIQMRLKFYTVRVQPKVIFRRVFLIGTEDFGNLGDHQIAVSEIEFLEQYFEKVIEISASEYESKKRKLIKAIRPDDVIFLTGGGNLGNEYPLARYIRNDVIKKWPKNMKIIMPQTAYYTTDKGGKKALKQDIRLFTRRNVTIIAREKASYQFLIKYFHCRIELAPDIVFHSAYNHADIVREDIVFLCLRNDKEAIISDSQKAFLAELAKNYFSKTECMDTQLPYDISLIQRNIALEKIRWKFQSAGLVITDRLHGMIFSVITGTPCLVFENYNHKIRGSYEWIKELPYIRLVKNTEEVEMMLKTGFWKKKYIYDVSLLEPKYEILIKPKK